MKTKYKKFMSDHRAAVKYWIKEIKLYSNVFILTDETEKYINTCYKFLNIFYLDFKKSVNDKISYCDFIKMFI